MALAFGTKLGPYEIQSPLGAGGMGEVYRARDTRLDRVVAIKILPQHLSEKPAARERFDREARAISSLSHPNICHLYDIGQQDGISYLVMEYLNGETLADRLGKGPLKLEEVLKVGAEICEGLEKAHRNGVVHRDLKPSNIMLTKSGTKLMDFGLAKAPKALIGAGSSSDSLPTMPLPLTAEGTIVGTFQYMSPEQLEGKEADSRSDIFSLGAILYEMVTGKRAFEGKTTASTIAAVLAAEPKPISAIQPMSPPALEHLTTACLAKDPDERLQTAHDVKVGLRWIAQTGSQTGVPPRPLARHANWDRNALVAQKFDARSYVLSGEARTISDEVQYLPQIDLALFGVAGKGTLVVQTGKGAAKSQLKWFDRSGREAGTVGPPGSFANPALSPDGRRVAFDQPDPDGRIQDIWIRELSTDAVMRFTFGPGLNQVPVWRPDGKRVVFASNQGLEFALYQKNADGSGVPQQVGNLGGLQQGFWDWSRDGKYLLLWKYGDLWYMPSSDWQPKPLLQAKWLVRNAQFSPDGRWVAYSTNESGNWEVYVGPFPNTNGKWQVSRAGGEEPRWRRDRKELFYLSSDGKMMAVAAKTDGNFEVASPVALFQTHLGQPISSFDLVSYDVTADGQRFLINTKVDEPNAAPLSLILNWTSEMER